MSFDSVSFDSYRDAFDPLLARSTWLARQLLGDRDLAREVAAEALTRLYQHWEQLGPDADHRAAWTLRVTRNLAIDVLRRRSRESVLAEADVAVLDTGSELLLRIAVADALRQLPDRQREVIELRYLSDLSQAEVARVLEVRPGTVASHTSRAAARLRILLADEAHRRTPSAQRKELSMSVTSIEQAVALVGTEQPVRARITGHEHASFAADIGIPAVYRGRGQRSPQWTKSPDEFVGREFDCVIVDIDDDRRPLITDALAGDAAVEFAAVRARVGALHTGQRFTGTVTAVLPFGVFVAIGSEGLRGLVHVSLLDMAPAIGEPLEVEVVDTDVSLARISLRPSP
ncbi:MAG TPA: sigma-70 family RNA polymerase sigma factor [Mycobacteriales bacterium]|jgi:RNA polymerase sigma factor (sigma-70 family)|nr:sigma-70 family RNA polymerase sigma factor [Mycobacteriales bacterium]